MMVTTKKANQLLKKCTLPLTVKMYKENIYRSTVIEVQKMALFIEKAPNVSIEEIIVTEGKIEISEKLKDIDNKIFFNSICHSEFVIKFISPEYLNDISSLRMF